MRFFHISDTHIGPSVDYELFGVNTADTTSRVVEYINALVEKGLPVDCVIHTGDVTTDGDTVDYDGQSILMARPIFQQLGLPCHFVNGNHDDAELLMRHFGDHRQLFGASPTAGWLDYPDCRLVFLDARSTRDRVADPAGWLPEYQLDSLRQTVEKSSLPVIVLCHYPALPIDCTWMNQRMLISNGESLHRLLASLSSKVAGVFYGHIHHEMQMTRDAVLYSANGGLSCHFPTWPDMTTIEPQKKSRFSIQYVTVSTNGCLIKTIDVPETADTKFD